MPTPSPDQHPEDQAMLDLLAEHVPLSLLLDLVALPPGGSRSIYRTEVADLTWLDSAPRGVA